VLAADPLGYTAAVLALVHTSAAECATSFTSTSTQTVNHYVGGTGNSTTETEGVTFGGQQPGWGEDSGVELGWTVGGIVNETNRSPINAWPQAYTATAATPYTTTDWMTDTTWNLGNPAAPYQALEIPTSYRQSNPYPMTVAQTTTYSSTTGTDLSVNVGVNVGVFSFGVGVQLTYTTTDVYTTQPTTDCQVFDPSSTQTAVFYYTFDGGSLAAADVIHIWLAGYCPLGFTKC
jgi:hypothetical protein